MSGNLLDRIRGLPDTGSDALLEAFLGHVDDINLALYSAQEEAVLELFSGANVVLNTPTGSGKSLVAAALHFMALARGQRSFYTAPIKALVSEKFFALCHEFGPDNVGMMTGDATVNRDAPIICCTAEILANIALREGSRAAVDHVVMDEFHYYADRDRGVAWQVPLLCLPQARFLLMSATLGETAFFEERLRELTHLPTTLVRSVERPVPLDFVYRMTPLHETISDLLEADKAPIYIVHFTQRSAAEQAQNLMSMDFLSKTQKAQLKLEMKGARFDSPFGKELKRFLPHGVGIHHAGLLPKYRLLVEKLAQSGLLKVICGTDTLGVGVNIPIRTVLFTKLCKYDGEKTAVLSVRDFKQIAGRAGRKGFDDRGSVVVQAPEHVIENRQMEMKATGDAKKMRKLVRKKPPDRGYVHWDESTFERLQTADPERLVSRFQVTHGMLLSVLEGREDGCQEMKNLIRNCHESPKMQRRHGRNAIALFRSLMAAEVVELDRDDDGRPRVRVHADLQEEFSLNQALSLYLVEASEILDPDSETYALDLLSLVEATLENPTALLLRQVDHLKGLKVAELKAQGVEYDERMAELDKIEYPKPNAEVIYETFNLFAKHHPWVGTENIRPKSIARDMYETGASFVEYVKEYGLERSEGLLLRYLSDAYKAMKQSVPDGAKGDDVYDIEDWLTAVVRQVDSSLIDEWERLRDPSLPALLDAVEEEPQSSDITRDERAFSILIRNEAFRFVRHLARREYERALAIVDLGGEGLWSSVDEVATALAPYWEEHAEIRIDGQARGAACVAIEPQPSRWQVRQTLLDPEGHAEWFADLVVDVAASREAGRPILGLVRVAN